MFDPTCIISNGKWGYIMRHESCDYHVRPPLSVRINPLRLEIGIGRSRPCSIVLNRKGRLHIKASNAIFRLKHPLRTFDDFFGDDGACWVPAWMVLIALLVGLVGWLA